MEALSIREINKSVGGKLLFGSPAMTVTGVNTDTRTIKRGDLFFALKGGRADGHSYIAIALEAGATGLVISDESKLPPECNAAVIKVDDPLWALGDLAKYYRSKFQVQVVGVTGSVGKTMTKEMLSSILERKWKVLKNEMNSNNEIGVPLTLLQLDRSHEVVVLEMAMRGLGEIKRLASIAKPSYGIITNIGISHIERLGSQGAIADAKAELLTELSDDGLAVLNAEDGYYEVLKNRFNGRILSFGSCKDADVVATRITPTKDGRYSFTLLIKGGAIEIKLPVLGSHNVYNALSAAAVAIGLGVDLYTIRDGLENFSSLAMRMELVKSKGGYVILNDSYNASPASVLAALRTLNTLVGYNRKIAVLGDMLELGDYSSKAHHDVGIAVPKNGVNTLIAVGEFGKAIADGAREAGFPDNCIQLYADSLEAGEKLKSQLTAGDAILVKGSRGMKMEEIVRVLLSD